MKGRRVKICAMTVILIFLASLPISGQTTDDSPEDDTPFTELELPESTQALVDIPELTDHSSYWDGNIKADDPGLMYILVEPGIYSSIETELNTYISDITLEGYTPEVHTEGWADEVAVKTLLQTGYSLGMVGALFVGDIPVAWYEVENDFGVYGYSCFPCDLFYMDLDGIWIDDNPANGIYDNHIDGAGDVEPEIWIGRLYTSTLSVAGETEVSLICNYLEKTHEYRMGELQLKDQALVYVDDDWYPWADDSDIDVGLRYDDRTFVKDQYTTVASDYKDRLTEEYAFVHLQAHSSEWYHALYDPGPGSYTYVFNTDLDSIDPKAHFFNLFCCNSGDFTYSFNEGYLAGHYVFAGTYGLGAVTSTKTGSMLNFEDFYKPLSYGWTMGEAFLEWFKLNCNNTGGDLGGESPIYWFYGMTLIGDPTLDTFDDGPPSIEYDIPMTITGTGWQFVSFPINAESDVLTIFDDDAWNGEGANAVTWDIIYWYDPTDASDPWKSYNKNWGGTQDMPNPVTNRMGFWIHITDNPPLPGDGMLTIGEGFNPASETVTLQVGWNLVGYPSLVAGTASDLPGWGDTVTKIGYYNFSAPYDITETSDGTTLMNPGNAYWVYSTVVQPWNVAP